MDSDSFHSYSLNTFCCRYSNNKSLNPYPTVKFEVSVIIFIEP